MEKRSYTSKVKSYVQLNWFKLSLLALLLFVFLRKDLSFQFNLNNPYRIEQSQPSGTEQTPVNTKEKKGELLTQKKAAPKNQSNSTSLLSAVDFPLFGTGLKESNPEAELPKVDEESQINYIRRFKNVAVSESKKYGIPASIILANAIVHSSFGQRDLAQAGNNHFGIPCTSKWLGESGTYNDACYRHYENAWLSFRDHSLYLTSGRFAKLRNLPAGDYKAWAAALEKENYSDVYSDLAKRLIQTIEALELYRLD